MRTTIELTAFELREAVIAFIQHKLGIGVPCVNEDRRVTNVTFHITSGGEPRDPYPVVSGASDLARRNDDFLFFVLI